MYSESNIPHIRRRRNALILPNINNYLYDFENNIVDSDEEKETDVVNRIKNRLSTSILSTNPEVDDLEELLAENRKKKLELKHYKHNYQKLMENIPLNVIKKIMGDDKCSICLENSCNFDNNFVITSCFHTFHEKCLLESRQINFKCPLCRNNLKHSFYKKFQLSIVTKGVESLE